jgi:N-acetylglucosaminyldiphosphoundecaprenol N-acetyl-beta-D-mannosaminyltransferase
LASRIQFLGLPFSELPLSEICSQVLDADLVNGVPYHLVNAYTITLAYKDNSLYSTLQNGFLISDGKPLSYILRLRGSSLTQVRGADLMRDILRKSRPGSSHFFLGSTDHVLNNLESFAKEINPTIDVRGSFSPEFKENFYPEIDSWVEMIRNSRATIVWIGLGTPKQDFVANLIAKSLPVHVLSVGAEFDYLSGNISEAPKIIRSVGFEWLYRFLKEPRRLANRYLIGNFKFMIIAISAFMNKSK